MEKSGEERLDSEVVDAFRTKLLSWYDKNRRDLPWRRERDPYKIWVSEVMLQQTRVDTVIPYYERFMQRFPTLKDLASASEEEVVKAWEGLGYYSRVRNLHAAVREVVASYGGRVPDDREVMGRLKGVGPYTVGAVLSIAYNQRVPAVDGNVMRVFSRTFRHRRGYYPGRHPASDGGAGDGTDPGGSPRRFQSGADGTGSPDLQSFLPGM